MLLQFPVSNDSPFVFTLLGRIEIYGEMDVECARAYYEYGNALLMKEEDNPSDDLLGAAAKEARKAAASLVSIFAVSILS